MRADALFKAKKWRAAMTDAELAAKLDPSDADAWFILGMARSMLGGDPAQALAELDRAAALSRPWLLSGTRSGRSWPSSGAG